MKGVSWNLRLSGLKRTFPNTFRQKKAGHVLKIRNQHGTRIFNSNHGFWDPVEHCLRNSNHFKPKVLHSWQQGWRQQKDGVKWGLKCFLAKNWKRQVTEEDLQGARKHWKRGSASVVIREMLIKTTIFMLATVQRIEALSVGHSTGTVHTHIHWC